MQLLISYSGWSLAQKMDDCIRGWIPSAYLTRSGGNPKGPPPPTIAPPLVPNQNKHTAPTSTGTTSTATPDNPKTNVNTRLNLSASQITPIHTTPSQPSTHHLAAKDVPHPNVLPLEAMARTKGFPTWEARVAATVATARALDPKTGSVKQANNANNGTTTTTTTTTTPDQVRNVAFTFMGPTTTTTEKDTDATLFRDRYGGRYKNLMKAYKLADPSKHSYAVSRLLKEFKDAYKREDRSLFLRTYQRLNGVLEVERWL